MKKSLLLITAFILSMNTYGLTMAEYNLQITKINAIEDEQMRDLIKKELAKKIANEISSNISTNTQDTNENIEVEVSKPTSDKNIGSLNIEINNKLESPQVNSTIDQIAPVESRNGFSFQLGLSGISSQMELFNSDVTLYGSEISMGAIKTISTSHKFGFGLGVRKLYGDEIHFDSGSSENITDTEYFGVGLKASYSYMFTSFFGLGAYAGYNSGEIESCSLLLGCFSEDTTITDIGARVDFKVGVWQPYLTLGYSLYNIDDYEFDGFSLSLGLANFEF